MASGRRIASVSAGVTLGLIVPTFMAHAGEPRDEVVRPTRRDVYLGQPVGTCGYPSVVAVTSGSSLCTGTLIHPEIVVYAAHCGGGAKLVRFADALQGGVAVPVAECVTNPAYESGLQGQDYAYCRLGAPVAFPYTPPATGCALDQVEVGTDVALVGFGQHTVDNAGEGAGAGTKRHGASVVSWIDRELNEIGIDGYCQGDSGGPALWFDGTAWWALSVVSTGQGCDDAGGNGINALLEGALPWIEAQTGVDLTPCQDAQGRWAPGGACSGFAAGGATEAGTWSSSCEAAPRGGFASTCGEAFDVAEDRDPPRARIVSPERVTEVADSSLVVDLVIDATDDLAGVAWVGIEVDGVLLDVRDELAPYEFRGARFPGGAYVVSAVVEDHAGRRGVSEPIGIGVGEPAPPLPAVDEGCAVVPQHSSSSAALGRIGFAGWLLAAMGLSRRRRSSRPRVDGSGST